MRFFVFRCGSLHEMAGESMANSMYGIIVQCQSKVTSRQTKATLIEISVSI